MAASLQARQTWLRWLQTASATSGSRRRAVAPIWERRFRDVSVAGQRRGRYVGDFTNAEIEAGRRLFAGEWNFVSAAGSLASLPPMGAPEIAFAGRSNVGKSSLINALTGRRALARTSNTPGRTQELVFFRDA